MPEEPKLILLNECASTNLYALEHLEELPHLSAIFADYQTAGRGRLGRKWFSPRGNIYATFVLKEFTHPLPCLAFAAGLASINTLKSATSEYAFKIKLPNDIICENRKIGGILCESRKLKSQVYLIIGIGLNINSTKEELANCGTEATSLYILTGRKCNISELRIKLWQELKLALTKSENEIISEFISNCQLVGKLIAVKNTNEELKGILETIFSDGAALIRLPDGSLRKIYSADFISEV